MSLSWLVRLLLALFAIFAISPQVNPSQILGLFVNRHRSHLLVYAAVTRLLLERGHNVTLVTTLNVEHLFSNSKYNLRFIKLPEPYINPQTLSGNTGIFKVPQILKGIEQSSTFLNDTIWREFLLERNHFDLLILGYLFNDYQLGVSAHFNCPAIIIWTGQPISYINRLAGNPEERRYVTQPYDGRQRGGWKALAFGIFEKAVEQLTLETMARIYNFDEVSKNVSLILCNHHSISEGPIAPYVPAIIEIGGIQIEAQHSGTNLKALSLPKASRLIVLSFGTRANWSTAPDHIVDTFRRAFKHFPSHTIYWTYDGDCDRLTNDAPNIRCAAWWPQSTLLAHPAVELLITHGGKGSISEAMYYGVAMLGFPLFGDQRANIAKMVRRGFGLQLSVATVTSVQLTEVITELISQNKSYSTNVKQFSQLYRDRPLSAAQSATYWIEYVIRHRGATHLRCSALHLNTLQYYSIDVYAFLALTLATFFVAVNWIVRILEH